MEYNVVIIGGGPSGLSAGIYASRKGAKVLVIEKLAVGGLIALAGDVENYPAFSSIKGFELAGEMFKHAQSAGVDFLYDEVVSVEATSNAKIINLIGGKQIHTQSIILAMGTMHRKLEILGEDKFIGGGLSYCATCDGSFFKGKDVAIVGGGDTACLDADVLANIASKVYIVYRRNKLRANNNTLEKIEKHNNIKVIYNSTVKKLIGNDKIEGIEIENANGERTVLKVSGVFVAIGLTPQTEIVKNFVALDEGGYVVCNESGETNIAGVFACGDITANTKIKQVVTAVSSGAVAGDFSAKFALK